MSLSAEALYHQHAHEVLIYLTRRCPEGVAHDLLQDTFLQVVRHPERLKAVSSPRAWIYAIARNILANYFRRQPQSACSASSLPDAMSEGGEDPRLEPMRAAILKLPDELRETLELRLEEDLSYEDIAHVLAIPVGTVRSRLHNAVRRLRAELTKPEST